MVSCYLWTVWNLLNKLLTFSPNNNWIDFFFLSNPCSTRAYNFEVARLITSFILLLSIHAILTSLNIGLFEKHHQPFQWPQCGKFLKATVYIVAFPFKKIILAWLKRNIEANTEFADLYGKLFLSNYTDWGNICEI